MPRSICNLKFNVPNEIHVVFHNGSKYAFHLIIKESKSEFYGQFDCIAKNSDKCKTFSISIKTGVKIIKQSNKTTEFISCKVKFLDSMRFMATSLSNLVDNLSK